MMLHIARLWSISQYVKVLRGNGMCSFSTMVNISIREGVERKWNVFFFLLLLIIRCVVVFLIIIRILQFF